MQFTNYYRILRLRNWALEREIETWKLEKGGRKQLLSFWLKT